MFFKKFVTAIQRRMLGDDSGQTLVEYGLLIGLVAIAAIAGISLVAESVDSLWGGIVDKAGTAIAEVLGL